MNIPVLPACMDPKHSITTGSPCRWSWLIKKGRRDYVLSILRCGSCSKASALAGTDKPMSNAAFCNVFCRTASTLASHACSQGWLWTQIIHLPAHTKGIALCLKELNLSFSTCKKFRLQDQNTSGVLQDANKTTADCVTMEPNSRLFLFQVKLGFVHSSSPFTQKQMI